MQPPHLKLHKLRKYLCRAKEISASRSALVPPSPLQSQGKEIPSQLYSKYLQSYFQFEYYPQLEQRNQLLQDRIMATTRPNNQVQACLFSITKPQACHTKSPFRPLGLQEKRGKAVSLLQNNNYQPKNGGSPSKYKFVKEKQQKPQPNDNRPSEQQQSTIVQIGEYLINTKKVLGEGTYSKVCLGYNKLTRELVAAKILRRPDYSQLVKEVELGRSMHSQHIVKILDFCYTGKKAFIVMQYCQGGSLASLAARTLLSDSQVSSFLRQIAMGMHEVSRRGVIHRDLKLDNILLKEGVVKIADFGLAKIMGGLEMVRSQRCGTPLTMAPEVILQEKPLYSEKCDVWSFGVIAYQLYFKTAPFHSAQQIGRGLLELPNHSRPVVELIRGCLRVRTGERLSWEEVRALLHRRERDYGFLLLVLAAVFCGAILL